MNNEDKIVSLLEKVLVEVQVLSNAHAQLEKRVAKIETSHDTLNRRLIRMNTKLNKGFDRLEDSAKDAVLKAVSSKK